MTIPRRLDLYKRIQDASVFLHPGLFYVTAVSLDVSSVVPGQPIPITWSLHSLHGTGLEPGTVTARVYHDKFNVKLFESLPVPVVPVQYGVGTLDQKGLIAPPANGGVANDLYHIGNNTLRLEVTSNVTGVVFSITADLQVMPDQIAGWAWLGAEGTADTSAPSVPAAPFFPRFDFLINHGFKLSGRMSNSAHNPNIVITGSLRLVETPFATADAIDVESQTLTIAPGGHTDLLFAEIKKNWTWLISGIWVRNFGEPLAKSFVYSVRFSFSDSYNNFYDDIVSPLTLMVTVSVSDEKRGYADGALAALGVGLILAIFSFGAGLSAAQAIAGGLGDKALDPPEPDARYRARVDIPGRISPKPAADPRFTEVMHALEAAERAAMLFDALGDIHNRLLGARLVDDREAVQMQRASYQEAESELRSTVEALMTTAARAVVSVRQHADFTPDTLEARLRAWQRAGIPSDVRSRLGQEGASDETIAGLSRTVQDSTVVALAQDLSQTLSLMAYSIARAARELHARSDQVLGQGSGDPRGVGP
ncbi:MAG TPA: hypothetical protein VLB76_18740 [Thermoanaerobaculia bacterium]|jgi:hypothetical protein|nr:hypothetical protein [Thermoanaerobaculia bacterium]